MRILYVWDADYPWDVRVEKICKSLVQDGHQTHIFARNLKKRPEREPLGELTIHRLRAWRSEKLNYALSFPVFFSPFWLLQMNRVVRDERIQLIIVRDLPMAIAAIWVGKLRKVPVIFDMAEDYVSMIRELWESSRFKGLNLLVRNPYLARLVEKYVFRHVQHTLVVVEEMKEVVRGAGGDASRTTIVGNTPPLSFFSTEQHQPEALRPLDGRYKAIYTGGVEPMRGLQTVIAALPSIVTSIPGFTLVVVGSGPNLDALKAQVTATGLGDHVLWLGWVDHSELVHYIRDCDVGIIPHLVSRHVDTTIPNKIFDYMGCGVPVIASDARPMQRILSEERAGVVFRGGDSEDFAAKIAGVYKSQTDYGSNGRNAVMRKYNWKHDALELQSAVKLFDR